MGQQNRRNRNLLRANQRPPQLSSPPQVAENKKFIFFKKTWAIIGGIILLLGGIGSYLQVNDYFLTPQEKHDRDFFYQGYLKPVSITPGLFKPNTPLAKNYEILPVNFDAIDRAFTDNTKPFNGLAIKFDNYPFIICYTGLYAFPIYRGDIKKGVRIIIPTKNACDIKSFLDLVVRDNRVFISIEFKDLKSEETIGFINYNHWKLYKPNVFDVKSDGERKLTVFDKQHNVVFQIDTYGRGAIFLAGYFITQKSITVIPNRLNDTIHPVCIVKSQNNWKDEAQRFISLIKSDYVTPVDPDLDWPKD